MHKQSAEEIKNLLKETYRRLDERISSLDILKDKTDKVIQLPDKEDIADITDLIPSLTVDGIKISRNHP